MKKQPNSIRTFNRFMRWLEKINSSYMADVLQDNELFVNLMEKFAFLDH